MNLIKSQHGWRKLFCAAAVLAGGLSARADESWQTNYTAYGKLIVTPFVTAPFPHPARAAGHKYHEQFFSMPEHYADSTVAMFIPKNFRATDRVDFVVHFHGWNNTVAGTLAQFNLIGQFCDSGKNAVLIVPEGPVNASDSFGGKLEDTNGFARFMDEAMTTLRTRGGLAKTNFEMGNIIIAGHSGGYHVMAAILDHGGLAGSIKETWLFDALYGNVENYVAWQKDHDGKLLDIYTDNGGTKANSEALMASLKTNGVSFFAAEEPAVTPGNLQTNKLVFVHTAMTHNQTVAEHGTFGQFLKTSCLEPR